jgi:hypothetical protein
MVVIQYFWYTNKHTTLVLFVLNFSDKFTDCIARFKGIQAEQKSDSLRQKFDST